MSQTKINSPDNILSALVDEWLAFTLFDSQSLENEQNKKKETLSTVNFTYMKSNDKQERIRIQKLLQKAIENRESTKNKITIENKDFIKSEKSIENRNENSIDAFSISETMESCLFRNYFYTNKAIYYAKARILCENLTKNGAYLLSHYDAEILCYFPSDALASGTFVEEWRSNYKYLLDQKLLAKKETRYGLFECHHCHSKNTDNYQSQTRSADEPATIFVNCFDCGAHFRR